MENRAEYTSSLSEIEAKIQAVLADPSVRYMPKRWLQEALTKDCVDAVRDAEMVAALLRERTEAISLEAAE